MRIAHYMHYMWSPGGVGSYIRNLSQHQHQAGDDIFFIDPHVFTPNLPESIQAFGTQILLEHSGKLIHQCQDNGIEILHLHTSVPLDTLEVSGNLRILRSIHNHDVYCPSGSRYLQQWGTPCDRAYSLVGCLQGHVIDRCGSLKPQNMAAGFQRVRRDLKTICTIPTIAYSKFVKQQMVRSGYIADQIYVTLLPVTIALTAQTPSLPPPNPVRFLYLGRIAPQKGWEWLLKSFAKVKIPCHLDIAGTGNTEQEQSIRNLADQLNLDEKVTFHGWVESARASQLLQQARALIFPSVWHEPAGLVTIEAAAAGRAVIASHVGGIPEYANVLGNSLLVNPNDLPGLTQTIELLATDWDLAAQLGQIGREQVAQKLFSLAGHEQTIRSLYQRVLDN
jgi:glycosyltransferase involved in cell wall biosynthesis